MAELLPALEDFLPETSPGVAASEGSNSVQPPLMFLSVSERLKRETAAMQRTDDELEVAVQKVADLQITKAAHKARIAELSERLAAEVNASVNAPHDDQERRRPGSPFAGIKAAITTTRARSPSMARPGALPSSSRPASLRPTSPRRVLRTMSFGNSTKIGPSDKDTGRPA